MISDYSISTSKVPESQELLHLFRQASWARHRTISDIKKLLGRMDVCVTITFHGQLIGFGRALSDGICRALLDDIIVDEHHRGRGLGQLIVQKLMEQLPGIEEIFLNTEEELHGFYRKSGFVKFDGLTMVQKQNKASDREK
jgi:GNAT superfamily N-acetyltransferase